MYVADVVFSHNLHRAIPWHAPCCAACSRSWRCFPGRPPGAFVYSVVKVRRPLTPCRQVQNCFAILTLAAVAVYGGFAMSHDDKFRIAPHFFTVAAVAVYGGFRNEPCRQVQNCFRNSSLSRLSPYTSKYAKEFLRASSFQLFAYLSVHGSLLRAKRRPLYRILNGRLLLQFWFICSYIDLLLQMVYELYGVYHALIRPFEGG